MSKLQDSVMKLNPDGSPVLRTNGQPAKRQGRKPIPMDVNQVKKMASLGMSKTEICIIIGIPYKSMYEGPKKRYNDFQEAYEIGRSSGMLKVTSKLMGHIDNGNVDATKFYLKAKGKWRENEPAVQVNITKVSDEASQKLKSIFSEVE